jgi:hypothetical protein
MLSLVQSKADYNSLGRLLKCLCLRWGSPETDRSQNDIAQITYLEITGNQQGRRRVRKRREAAQYMS